MVLHWYSNGSACSPAPWCLAFMRQLTTQALCHVLLPHSLLPHTSAHLVPDKTTSILTFSPPLPFAAPDELLEQFLETFPEETSAVQLQLVRGRRAAGRLAWPDGRSAGQPRFAFQPGA